MAIFYRMMASGCYGMAARTTSTAREQAGSTDKNYPTPTYLHT